MNNTKEFLEEHLYYELAMFYNSVFLKINYCKDMLQEEIELINNMKSETAVNHARGLIEFFFIDGKSKNDAKAYDFFNSQKEWSILRGKVNQRLIEDFNIKAGGEVMHISYDRKSPSDPNRMPFIFNDLYMLLRTIILIFLQNLKSEYKGTKLIALQNQMENI